MNLIIIHRNNPQIPHTNDNSDSTLHFAMSNEPVADIVFDCLGRCLPSKHKSKSIYAIPEKWNIESQPTHIKTLFYKSNTLRCSGFTKKNKRNKWFTISNGRFATQIAPHLLNKLLDEIQADIIAINAEPKMLSKQENMRLTPQGKIAGFHRLYSDSFQISPVSNDWPHHLFIKANLISKCFADDNLPLSFTAFLEKCRQNNLRLRAVDLGGIVLDLETEDGLLDFCRAGIAKLPKSNFEIHGSNKISTESRFVGDIILGKNIHIDHKAIIIGPSIINNNVKIEQGTVINSSIIGPGTTVPQNQFVQNRVIEGQQYNWKKHNRSINKIARQSHCPTFNLKDKQQTNKTFRSWPVLSYAGSLKRVIDCFFAIIVLTLFAPIIPFIALAVKLSSPGPVFFKDKRQGLHGKKFNCLKFRTMRLGADKMQDKLRFVSQVDGPQFKMDDDPRISAVGRFLRETYLDEIPQFINVLLGQMSIIGPRPSPELENTLCPFWRDARLSVRPGITGLWQICRTRQPMKDFQEWIHYDIKYVINLSIKTDLWIFWKTTKKLVDEFVNQF